MEILVVLSTFPNLETARQIATVLVEAQLAACVSLCPAAESIYRWQGRVESAAEVLALIKTTAAGFEPLERRLRELHPYEVPEIIALPAGKVSEAYVKWVQESVVA